MLASVAASPVSWPGPWHARVRPASEPAFQPLMACGCFFTTVPGSGLPAGVCLCWACQCPRRARSCCLCCPASVIRCSYKRAREIRVPCVRVLDRSVFLSGYRSCPLWVCVFISPDLPPSGACFSPGLHVSFLSPSLSSPRP